MARLISVVALVVLSNDLDEFSPSLFDLPSPLPYGDSLQRIALDSDRAGFEARDWGREKFQNIDGCEVAAGQVEPVD